MALLRAEAGREPYDRALRELVGELSTVSPEFRTQWAAHDVRIRHEGIKRLLHPEVGELDLTYQSLDLPIGNRAMRDLTVLHGGAGLAGRGPATGARQLVRYSDPVGRTGPPDSVRPPAVQPGRELRHRSRTSRRWRLHRAVAGRERTALYLLPRVQSRRVRQSDDEAFR